MVTNQPSTMKETKPDVIMPPVATQKETISPNFKNKVLGLSPHCDKQGKCKDTMWSAIIFGLCIIGVAIFCFVISGQVTGQVYFIDIKYTFSVGAFAWIALISGIGIILLWALYFFGVFGVSSPTEYTIPGEQAK